jgi:Protein of unknown function (DUF1573)
MDSLMVTPQTLLVEAKSNDRISMGSAPLGALLLLAAALKAHGLAVAPVSAMGWLSAPWSQVALIEAEVLLGLCLLTGVAPLGSWTAACVAFTAFAAISLYQALIGRASCGCFGRLALNPWYAFGIDVAALAALAPSPPDLRPLWREPRTALLRPLGIATGWLAGGMLAFAGLVGAAAYQYGSFDAALAHFRGNRVAVVPALVDVGDGTVGDTREATVAVTNYTDRPVRVIGGTSDCSCVVTENLPLAIPPGETRSLLVRIQLTGQPGIFTRTANLLTDDGQSSVLRIRLTGRSFPVAESAIATNQ